MAGEAGAGVEGEGDREVVWWETVEEEETEEKRAGGGDSSCAEEGVNGAAGPEVPGGEERGVRTAEDGRFGCGRGRHGGKPGGGLGVKDAARHQERAH